MKHSFDMIAFKSFWASFRGLFIGHASSDADNSAETGFEPVNRSDTSQGLTIDELRLLGVALDLAESPITLYGKNLSLIYANAAARSYWPVTYTEMARGRSLEAATIEQIRALAPEISDADLESNLYEVFDGLHQKKPKLIHASEGRLCRITHHPIGNIAIAGVGIDISELRKKRHELSAARRAAEFRAVHDTLTSLPNRDEFKKIVEQRMIDEPDQLFWLLMCDIDKFKLVNDIYGHDVGDAVLVKFADFVKDILGDDAIVSRLGGDEFAILISCQSDRQPTAANLQRIINERIFEVRVGDQNLSIGFSAGAAQYPTDAYSYRNLLKRADLALLRSKNNNNDRIDFYDSELGIEYECGLNLFTEFQTAISEGQIKPFFQPIIDTKARKIHSLEALARWEHPERGLLVPGDFSKVFDDKDLSLQLSRYMLKAVTNTMIEWFEAGIPICQVNINVEASDLLNPSFLADLMARSTADVLLPKYLCLEITENSILNVDNQALLDSLTAIRALGIKVLLDDFGTGFSSITHLDHLPITGLKLDKSYVQKICSNDRSRRIVEAIVDLAKSLDLSTVAEGIEDEPALQAMEQIGCTAYQGYHFSHPMSAYETEIFLRAELDCQPPIEFNRKHG
ncbi:putative bifunctional diguanylate cyclase/phosphodiesterase [Parasphingorhabdus sp.]|uniref:putative bifunctional diguanylate cyclase/phosphodiesterase n=1 Tax=Parasphingorhabdus sp. TaxID=2709688 RepID=UPI003002B989